MTERYVGYIYCDWRFIKLAHGLDRFAKNELEKSPTHANRRAGRVARPETVRVREAGVGVA